MSAVTGHAHGREPCSAATSWPEKTANTPAAVRAASRFTDVIRACACGLRRNAICARPGSVMLSVDRKSTRLNSSHQIISYAVFCLKKKNKKVNSSQKLSAEAVICMNIHRINPRLCAHQVFEQHADDAPRSAPAPGCLRRHSAWPY